MRVAQEAVIPDAGKTIRQHVDQKATDELAGLKGHRLLAVVVPVILPAKADLAILDRQQAVVGNGDAVGIPPDILKNLSRSGEWPLGIDDPLGISRRCQIAAKGCRLMQVAVRGEETQFAAG